MQKSRLRKYVLKAFRFFLVLIFSGFIVVIIFEFAYRYQWWDAYSVELNALNSKSDLESKKPAILVMGDSFSATSESYVSVLRDSLPEYRIINSAVPGTCVLQSNYMAANRFSEFNPSIFIYQIYVGNDLFDLRYPVSGGEISLARRIYWWMSNRFRSLSYLNYKSGQFNAGLNHIETDSLLKRRSTFSPNTYSAREKLYLKADPTLIGDQVLLQNGREVDFEYWSEELRDLLSRCENGKCKVILLVIPHCAQLNPVYYHRMVEIGAKLPSVDSLIPNRYLFLTRLESRITGLKNVSLISALPVLKALDSIEPTYYHDDPHLSIVGQKEIAKLLLGKIKE